MEGSPPRCSQWDSTQPTAIKSGSGTFQCRAATSKLFITLEPGVGSVRPLSWACAGDVKVVRQAIASRASSVRPRWAALPAYLKVCGTEEFRGYRIGRLPRIK